MNRESIRGGFVILVGVGMLALWVTFYATGQIPEFETNPYEILYHLFAEILTAVALIVSGVGLFRRNQTARRLYPVALGLLLYTVINSAGYYADLGEAAMVGMFAVLTIATLVGVLDHLTGRPKRPSSSATRREDIDV